MGRPKYLQYKVTSKLPRLLGRESVSTEIQALFELVKNSYDADSPKVILTFKNIDLLNKATQALLRRYRELVTELQTKLSDENMVEIDKLAKSDEYYLRQEEHVKKISKETEIIVEDFGKGMTLNELQEKWMQIGVSKSQSELITPKGRRVVGEKGVGRFAVERLSHKTILISKPQTTKTSFILEADWDHFEKSNKDVGKIRLPISYKQKKESESGLIIRLIGLRDEWNSQKIKKVIDELSLLVLPKEINPKNLFKIQVKYEKGGKKEVVNVGASLLNMAPYHFVAELTPYSTIEFTSVRYKKQQIVPNLRGIEFPAFAKEFPFRRGEEKTASVALCGPLKFEYYGFPFDPSGRNLGWTDHYGETKVGRIKGDLEDYHGLKIYRDGFRVRPYGEPGNDWLGLGTEARTTAGKLPNKNTMGWITISSEKNPKIIDTTTREKIIENEAFEDMTQFAKETMAVYNKFAEQQRQRILKKEATKDVPNYIKKLRNKIAENPSIPARDKRNFFTTLDKLQTHYVREEERITIEKDSLMDEKDAYRNLASLGITTGVVSHEIKDFLKVLLLHTGVLKREADKISIDQKQLKKSLEYMEPSVHNLRSYMALIGGFSSAMASRKKEFRQKKNLNLHNQVREIFKGLDGIFKRWDIKAENKVPHELPKLKMYQADLQSIILNLISNSIKSLRQLSEEREKASPEKKNRIKIRASMQKENFVITYSDNGLGVPPMDKPYIFDLFWTKTNVRATTRSGSGLGMPIVKEIVHDYNGDVIIEEKSEFPTGVTFKILIPKQVIIR